MIFGVGFKFVRIILADCLTISRHVLLGKKNFFGTIDLLHVEVILAVGFDFEFVRNIFTH